MSDQIRPKWTFLNYLKLDFLQVARPQWHQTKSITKKHIYQIHSIFLFKRPITFLELIQVEERHILHNNASYTEYPRQNLLQT